MRAPEFEPVVIERDLTDGYWIQALDVDGRPDLVTSEIADGVVPWYRNGDCGPDDGKISWLGNPGTFSDVAVGPVGDDTTAHIATVEQFHCDDPENVVFLNRFGAATHREPAIPLGPREG